MAATAAALEEIAVALPGSILVMNSVRIIISEESYRKRFYPNTIALFSIALRFLYLTDQS